MKLSAKKICEYKNGCPYLATHNCQMCSTFHCDLHVSRHFDESHNIDLRKNELQWFLFAAGDKTLGIPCIYNAVEGQCDILASMLCIICEMAFCSDHSSSHDCIGTQRVISSNLNSCRNSFFNKTLVMIIQMILCLG